MNKKFFTDIKNIRDAIDTNKLVVFAGAGISVDAGIPTWEMLIDELKSEVSIPISETDFLRIAQMYYNERQQKEYIDKIRTVLKHKKIKHNEIHKWIFKLNPEHVLTTNFDNLLEQAIKRESLPFSIVSKDKEFPYALNTSLLVKIHGDLNDTDIVLKEDDYLDYSQNHPLIEAFLKSVFASKVVLLVGYGFSDINLKMIVQSVRNILGKDFQNAHLLSVEENLHPTQREYLKNKGINVINYFDAVNGDGENYITEYLNGKNALNERFYVKGKTLSDKGQNLLNFLVFLSTYDKFNEPLTDKNIIDQIYLSLERFSEFTSLPPDFIANLYPFNNCKRYSHNYKPYSLLLKNNSLVDLFFNQIEYGNNNAIVFKPKLETTLTDSEIKEIEKKLQKVIKTLSLSSIFSLFKENEKPDSLGYYGWSDDSIRIQKKSSEKCNCFNCRLKRFEFNSVITDTISLTVNETTNVKSDIELAYVNYRIGNFHQSYKLFEETANKAWQARKYFYYFIAKHNIKTLRNLIDFYERNLKQEEREKIIQDIDDIDFDKLLSQIPYLGEKEYELFKLIRDNNILHRSGNKIEEIFRKAVELFDNYQRGGFSFFGPYYPQQIMNELYKVISFYTNNYIVADVFTNFKKVIQKGIEALLINYATSEDYQDRITEFNKNFFDVFVSYGDTEELKKIAQKYNIKKIKFKKDSLPDIIELTNNFLMSFFEENVFLGRIVTPNKQISNQVNNYFFEDLCRRKFNNIFFLLSEMDIEKDKASNLTQNLIDFLQHETFFYKKESKTLSLFLSKQHQLFSKENIENILKLLLAKFRIYNDEDNMLHAIAYIFKENDFEKISDEKLILNLVSLSESNNNKKSVSYLWQISNDKIKETLKQKNVEYL